MSKLEAPAATVTMADEENHQQQASIKEGFFRHYRAFIWCGFACIGGFQLGSYCSHHPR